MRLQPLRFVLKAPSEPRTQRVRMFLSFVGATFTGEPFSPNQAKLKSQRAVQVVCGRQRLKLETLNLSYWWKSSREASSPTVNNRCTNTAQTLNKCSP